jgi:hypothetical protein
MTDWNSLSDQLRAELLAIALSHAAPKLAALAEAIAQDGSVDTQSGEAALNHFASLLRRMNVVDVTRDVALTAERATNATLN